MKRALSHSLFLQKGITFEALVRWFGENQSLKPTDYKKLSVTQDLNKITTFHVHKFKGDTLTGDDFIEDVDRAFRSATMAQFLDSKSCCENSPTWSDAFASRLRGSVVDSDILGFLATELESEKNCAKVWTRIQLMLNSSDVTTARIMENWQALFSLKCEDYDSFLSFYSKSKSTLHKLKKSKSIAITDAVFLKAFFAKVISVDKIQGKSKKILKGGTETCAEILESIHSN